MEHSEVSRIMLHVFDELCSDVIPNFTFNGAVSAFFIFIFYYVSIYMCQFQTQRFVRPDSKTVMEFGDGQPKRDKLPNVHRIRHFFL